MNRTLTYLLITGLIACLSPALSGAPDAGQEAAEILRATGIRGGLVVHLNCGDGRLAAAIGAHEHLVVHGLAEDPESVAGARERIASLGLYGKVSVAEFAGSDLPYIDNLVNLLICDEPSDVPMREIMRVLVPNGVVYLRQDGKARKIVKPRPPEIDEWTHYMHDPSNNAVAHDTVVGPPRRLQWDCEPKWTRSHEKMSGMHALVSAGGRIFYTIDEGPMASIQLPADWKLIARDAFNGALLWKRSIPKWYPHLWPLKSGPAKLPRRLVAVGDRAYVTLGYEEPVTMLDAATGKTLLTYDGTAGTEGLIVSEGVLFANVIEDLKTPVFKPKDPFVWNEAARARIIDKWTSDRAGQSVAAFNAETGKPLWRKAHPVAPLSLGADAKSVYFSDGQKIICLRRDNGEQRWQSESIASVTEYTSQNAPTLVIYKDVILYSPTVSAIVALDARDGSVLWRSKHPRAGHHSPGDVLVVNDLVWSGGSGATPFIGKNLLTGKVEVSFKPPEMTWFHPRCHRSKATDLYVLASRTGIEFADVRERQVTVHHWTRGACVYGIMPCNGLIYTPPNPCACLHETKTRGFNALAPALDVPLKEVPDENRLQRGPAHGDVRVLAFKGRKGDDWPTYRHDAQRSGFAAADVSPSLKQAWQTEIGGRLSSLVSVAGRIFAVSIDTHMVHALDAVSGDKLWSFTAGARVDSPPTVHHNLVIFGSRDGWVYCLRASDGKLAWRFLAAPAERMLMSYGQLESVWPVNGSVLVQNDIVHFVAGRSLFLDGGMRFYRLHPASGQMLSVNVMDDKDPETGKNLQELQAGWIGLTMPVALPDILSSDGKRIYMRSQQFDLEGKRLHIAPDLDVAHQGREGAHLFSPVGLLDDTWMHRTYWMYGVTVTYGWRMWFEGGRFAPAGRILAFDDENIYGFGRKPEHYAQSPIMEYQLYAADRKPDEDGPDRVLKTEKIIASKARDKRERGEGDKANWKLRKQHSAKELTAVGYQWRKEDPSLLAKSMVLTNKILFIAGPPNLVNEEKVWDNPDDISLKKKLAAQSGAWQGKHGAVLRAVDTSNGETVAGYELDAVPVFDGMICAGGRLYAALADGNVVCFEQK
ncbi:MAG: outer membrane protein assembly factor BamB family protein [Planctomycetota bacterium]